MNPYRSFVRNMAKHAITDMYFISCQDVFYIAIFRKKSVIFGYNRAGA